MPKVKCVTCGNAFWPRAYNHRFCSKACNDAYYTERRRQAMEMLRNTYHGRAMLDAVEGGGGRFAAVDAENFGQPLPTANWSHDPVGKEPPITGDGPFVGEALGGAGGGRR